MITKEKETNKQVLQVLDILATRVNENIHINQDSMNRIEDKIDKVDSNAQLRDNALRESFGGSFYDVYNSLSDINMKQMDIKAYSKRIEDKLDRLVEFLQEKDGNG